MAGRGPINLAFRLAPVLALGATALPAAEIGDAESGAVIWGDCAGCHQVGPGAALAAPKVLGQTRPRVVVIGGGATNASYLAKDSDGALDVTLVEPAEVYYTCFFSNLYIGGIRDFESLAHGYDKLTGEYGITHVRDIAAGVDRAARTVTLAGGEVLSFDRLVIAPGIDFVEGSVPGWDLSMAEIMPHAYKAGPQTQFLKRQVEVMPEGGTFCMVAPPNPYRCPPGPCERISMVAHVLRAKNLTAKILIVDPKEKHYSGMITRIGPDFGAAKVEVRPDAMEVVIDGEVEKADVCNVIPAQKVGITADIFG